MNDGRVPSTIIGVEFYLEDYRSEDFEVLWAIDQQCFVPGIAYSRSELDAYMQQPGSFTVVARSASGILGFLVASVDRRRAGHIITIDVLPQAQRIGMGSKLLSNAEDRLRSAGCRSVYLETAVDNRAALVFYKRHRYFLVKTLPGYYASGVDALVLEKDLLSAAPAS